MLDLAQSPAPGVERLLRAAFLSAELCDRKSASPLPGDSLFPDGPQSLIRAATHDHPPRRLLTLADCRRSWQQITADLSSLHHAPRMVGPNGYVVEYIKDHYRYIRLNSVMSRKHVNQGKGMYLIFGFPEALMG